MWLQHSEYETVVKKGWSKGGTQLSSKLSICLEELDSWSEKTFGAC